MIKKFFLKGPLLLGGMFLLFNCQQDDFVESVPSVEHQDEYIVNKISFKEVRENGKAFQKLKEARTRNTSFTGRGVFNEDYGVFVDTTNIMLIEKDDSRSITFQIINENSDTEIQNLILNSVNGKDYKAYIATYVLSQEELGKILNDETLGTKLPSSVTEFNQFARGGVLGDGADCIDVYTYTQYYCTSNEGKLIKANGEVDGRCKGMSWPVEQIVYKIAGDCMSSGGLHGPDMPTNPGSPNTGTPGGTYIPGSNNPGNSTPGTGTNPNNPATPPTNPEDQIHDPGNGPIITTPLIVRNTKKPCEQLSKTTTIPGYENDINVLKQRALGTKEYAWAYKYSSTTGSFLPGTIVGDSQANPNKVDLSAFMGGDYVGAAHNHLNPNITDGIAMFSPGDIRWLFQCARRHNTNGQPKDYSLYFLLLIVEGRNYAIKIKDGNKFQLNFSAKFPAIERDLEKRYKESTQYADAFTLQKDLLKVLKENDIGVGLYEEIETNGNKVWNELTLDPAYPNANPLKKPCN